MNKKKEFLEPISGADMTPPPKANACLAKQKITINFLRGNALPCRKKKNNTGDKKNEKKSKRNSQNTQPHSNGSILKALWLQILFLTH